MPNEEKIIVNRCCPSCEAKDAEIRKLKEQMLAKNECPYSSPTCAATEEQLEKAMERIEELEREIITKNSILAGLECQDEIIDRYVQKVKGLEDTIEDLQTRIDAVNEFCDTEIASANSHLNESMRVTGYKELAQTVKKILVSPKPPKTRVEAAREVVCLLKKFGDKWTRARCEELDKILADPEPLKPPLWPEFQVSVEPDNLEPPKTPCKECERLKGVIEKASIILPPIENLAWRCENPTNLPSDPDDLWTDCGDCMPCRAARAKIILTDPKLPPKRLSDKEFLESVWDAIYEAETADEESIRQALIEAGIDPDKLVEDGMSMINKLKEKQRELQSQPKTPCTDNEEPPDSGKEFGIGAIRSFLKNPKYGESGPWEGPYYVCQVCLTPIASSGVCTAKTCQTIGCLWLDVERLEEEIVRLKGTIHRAADHLRCPVVTQQNARNVCTALTAAMKEARCH